MPPGSGGLNAVALLITPEGLVIDTGGAAINSYVLTSKMGIFTGGPADNLGLFQEHAHERISGGFAFTLTGTHRLGNIIGSEFSSLSLEQLRHDLSFTYTLHDAPGIYEGTLVVPEPGTLMLLAAGLLGPWLAWRGRKRMVRRRSARRAAAPRGCGA